MNKKKQDKRYDIIQEKNLPFEVLAEKPTGYSLISAMASEDGQWTFDSTTSYITHQRNDNSRFYWEYDRGTQDGDDAVIGSLGTRKANQ